MAKRKLFLYLAAASGYIGLGLILGYLLSDQTTNNPLWVGVVLTFFGAILMGMFISAHDESTNYQDTQKPPPEDNDKGQA